MSGDVKVIDLAIDSKIPHGTQIVLKPDTLIFENTEFSKETLQNWFSENYSGVNFSLLFPRQPHFNKVLHVLVKIHWRRSNVNLLKSFLYQWIFVATDSIR